MRAQSHPQLRVYLSKAKKTANDTLSLAEIVKRDCQPGKMEEELTVISTLRKKFLSHFFREFVDVFTSLETHKVRSACFSYSSSKDDQY